MSITDHYTARAPRSPGNQSLATASRSSYEPRSGFSIGPDGKVTAVFPKGHVDEVLAAIRGE